MSTLILKHETYSVIKHSELLAENTIKSEVRQLSSKYKHGNDIPEHRNTVKRMNNTNLLLTCRRDYI